jgi:hypothetical protein
MKLLLVILCGLPNLLWAQNMDGIAFKNPDISKTHPELAKVLKQDDTDAQIFINRRFTCNEFTMRFLIQRSSGVVAENIDRAGFEQETGVSFQTEGNLPKLNLYYVNLTHAASGFYHAIGAYLVNQLAPEKVESYIFFEPQTDEVMLTPKDIFNKYQRFYGKLPDAKVEASISELISYKFNGNIYQNRTERILSFIISR